MARKIKFETVKFSKITPGGQALGELENGKKIFAWGVLPGEVAKIQITKNKKHFAEGFAAEILKSSPARIEPRDSASFLSTSPWQICDFDFEQKTKQELIAESFAQEKIELKNQDEFYSDGKIFEYRNKVEFSFWWEKSAENEDDGELNLAFFRRGGKGKVPILGTSLAMEEINQAGQKVLEILRARKAQSRDLKTLLIRASQNGEIAAQLYVKDEQFEPFSKAEIAKLGFRNFEIIFSNPKSPASVITEKIQTFGDEKLRDRVLGVDFNYATEGFFQINLPVYEQALRDAQKFIDAKKPTVDLYSGVGSIGLTIGAGDLTLVEINQAAVAEMQRNIAELGREKSAKAILAPSEKALEFIQKGANLIVDPPRAGMNREVCEKILAVEPEKVIYLSCNPTTQARDVAILSEKYQIIYVRGYNFFPRTPHIENLIVLELKK
ncbi:MAG: RsmD family RNA methyltransferase [bacterium]|nr:RsmD family RNA methyltransferase [bacterium]